VIVGEGQAVGLTKRRYRDLGGEETQTLLIDQMPNHKHKVHAIKGDYEPGARLMHRWCIAGSKSHRRAMKIIRSFARMIFAIPNQLERVSLITTCRPTLRCISASRT